MRAYAWSRVVAIAGARAFVRVHAHVRVCAFFCRICRIITNVVGTTKCSTSFYFYSNEEDMRSTLLVIFVQYKTFLYLCFPFISSIQTYTYPCQVDYGGGGGGGWGHTRPPQNAHLIYNHGFLIESRIIKVTNCPANKKMTWKTKF